MTIIDFSQYANMPRLDAAGAYVLSCKLTETPPSELTAAERSALRKIGSTAQRLQDVLRARSAEPTGVIRPCQLSLTAAWSAMYTALTAVARLPSGSELDIDRAKRLLELLFPSGISFTQQGAKSVFSDGQVLLDRVEHESLTTDLHKVIADDFLKSVRDHQLALRTALGIGREPHAIETLNAVLNDLMREIGNYVRILAGSVDVEDAASVQRFADAVQPIDEARVVMTRAPTGPSVAPQAAAPPPASHASGPSPADSPFITPASSPGTDPSSGE